MKRARKRKSATRAPDQDAELRAQLSTSLCHLGIMARKLFFLDLRSVSGLGLETYRPLGCAVYTLRTTALLMSIALRYLHRAWVYMVQEGSPYVHPSTEASMFDLDHYCMAIWSGGALLADFMPPQNSRIPPPHLKIYKKLLPIHIGMMMEYIIPSPPETT